MPRLIKACFLLLLPALFCVWLAFRQPLPPARKVIVLGVDGMDPQLVRRYMEEGKLPNLSRLAATGSFCELGTSVPPQSPVAWSSLITGLDPGGHGIFDFIHRDPATLIPYLSTSRVEPSRYSLPLGPWIIPLSGGKVELLRRGKAFWQILDDHGIPATIFRIPANFPPVPSKARTFAGMGTPDISGAYGTFSFFTDDPAARTTAVNGGNIYRVSPEGGHVKAALEGPPDSLRRDHRRAAIGFSVWIDPDHPAARIDIQGRELLLRQGEWSDWVPLTFNLIPYIESVSGICRFYAKQLHPRFELYVTPINLDPSRPALPLSTPGGYARDLWKQAGYFYTQGIAEDTKALASGVLTEEEYLQQARMVLADQLRIFDIELRRASSGLFFFYFSSLDQNGHILWRNMDPHHPAYDARYGTVLEKLYEEIDGAVGKALQRLDAASTLVVLSDHGFAPFYRSFNLNTWLLGNGYIALRPGAAPEGEFFANVDWSATRAYGLGLNGLYLNLRGRERHGIVGAGTEAHALADEISARLLQLRDPATGAFVVSRVDKSAEIYRGEFSGAAPDLIIGYNRGYRAGWSTTLGGFSPEILEDNLEPWSGDHCIDYRQVPGVLLSNKKIVLSAPRLTDIAPTILAEFGIPQPLAMHGRPLFTAPCCAQSSGAGLAF
jgi:predicted AlkP superfamily phosphohydrolase/phosphomutase